MAYKTPEINFTTAALDFTSLTEYSLFKNNTDNEIILPFACFFYLETSDTFVSAPEISVGSDSPSYSNFIAPTTLTGLATAQSIAYVFPDDVYFSVQPGDELYIKVNTAASASIYQVQTKLIGFYL
jgi:hypothetical protein